MKTDLKTKRLSALLLALCINMCCRSECYARELIVGGQAVGIQADTAGAFVAGMTENDGRGAGPAERAGVCVGDVIVSINGKAVNRAGELREELADLEGKTAELEILRGDERIRISVAAEKAEDGNWKLGIMLRDGVSGIGTLTFCDPESGIYGALGHSINDTDTGKRLELQGGSITDAEIVGVTAGVPGTPGELKGCADLGKILGDIRQNTACGIYGKYLTPAQGMRLDTGLIAVGPAEILCTVKGSQCKAYSVKVERIYRDAAGEHVLLTVTDPELIASAGGIVQGMSGSPIIQNGKLVGAVTHVFVNDPSKGCGVGIREMLKAAGIEG